MENKIVYKLFKVRKDGSLGSLFINPRDKLRLNIWLRAKKYPTKGFKVRNGWHSVPKPYAPHLSIKGRAWYKVEIKNFTLLQKPKCQGGRWFIAKKMKILGKAKKCLTK